MSKSGTRVKQGLDDEYFEDILCDVVDAQAFWLGWKTHTLKSGTRDNQRLGNEG